MGDYAPDKIYARMERFSWSAFHWGSDDIQYVRQDIVTGLQTELTALREQLSEVRVYRSAFFRVGALIAKSPCVEGCGSGERCIRCRLVTEFLVERRATEAEIQEMSGE